MADLMPAHAANLAGIQGVVQGTPIHRAWLGFHNPEVVARFESTSDVQAASHFLVIQVARANIGIVTGKTQVLTQDVVVAVLESAVEIMGDPLLRLGVLAYRCDLICLIAPKNPGLKLAEIFHQTGVLPVHGIGNVSKRWGVFTPVCVRPKSIQFLNRAVTVFEPGMPQRLAFFIPRKGPVFVVNLPTNDGRILSIPFGHGACHSCTKTQIHSTARVIVSTRSMGAATSVGIDAQDFRVRGGHPRGWSSRRRPQHNGETVLLGRIDGRIDPREIERAICWFHTTPGELADADHSHTGIPHETQIAFPFLWGPVFGVPSATVVHEFLSDEKGWSHRLEVNGRCIPGALRVDLCDGRLGSMIRAMNASSLFRLCAIVFGGILSLPAASVDLVEGGSKTSVAISIDAAKQEVLLGSDRLKLSEISSIRFGEVAIPSASDSKNYVLLADGSVLPALGIQSSGKDAVTIRSDSFNVTLTLGQVLAYGAPEWILAASPQKDRVKTATGLIEGDCQGIDNGVLRMKTSLSEKPLDLELDQVQGFFLALPQQTTKGLYLRARLAGTRMPWTRFAPVWPLRLSVAPKAELKDLESMPQDFWVVGGRRQALSALKPDTVVEEGLFREAWHYRIGSDLHDGSPVSLRGALVEEALILHSKAKLTWKLEGRWSGLEGRAGIIDRMGSEGDCALSILGDGKELAKRASIKGNDPVTNLKVDLKDVKVLEILVDYGGRHDIGDHLALDAWIVKK